jgi:hypothetical protein
MPVVQAGLLRLPVLLVVAVIIAPLLACLEATAGSAMEAADPAEDAPDLVLFSPRVTGHSAEKLSSTEALAPAEGTPALATTTAPLPAGEGLDGNDGREVVRGADADKGPDDAGAEGHR